jgi:hypothetical protein
LLDGLTLGLTEGNPDGDTDGNLDGDTDGDKEGLCVGIRVCLEGLSVGCGLGDTVACLNESSPAKRLNLEGAQH